MTVKVATIGFTQTTAQNFFERLARANVKTVFDVRLHSTSQLAGFAKGNDLPYFLKKLSDADYQPQPLLAPTDEMLRAFKKEKGDWHLYEMRFLSLLAERKIEERLKPEMFDGACLLCSEAKPHNCHRRLVCEYLNSKWDGILSVTHL